MSRARRLTILFLAVVGLAAPAAAAPALAGPAVAPSAVTAARVHAPGHAPVVLFPAFHFTRLQVDVHDQHTAPGCPRSGTFFDSFENPQPSATFSQVCRDELMTLRYDPDPRKPMADRFSNQPGVQVRIVDYGNPDSAPFYQPLYQALESVGYTPGRDIRVAGYDARLTPDQGGFLARTINLIEATYRTNGDRRVWLVGHSNGPLYAQYLLTHTSPAWRQRYIAGFTPIAGNLPGQGSLYSILFTGLNVADFSYPTTPANAVSSARMFLTSPATYMSAASPAIFGHSETVLEDAATGRRYTPADYRSLLHDAHLDQLIPVAEYYVGFVKFADPAHFPDVDVEAERGSGIATMVGAELPDLRVGQLVTATTPLFYRDGDGNQEDTTNTAIEVWAGMRQHGFELTENPGVGHFSLPSDPAVLARLVAAVTRTT